jgi:hypothetical protein
MQCNAFVIHRKNQIWEEERTKEQPDFWTSDNTRTISNRQEGSGTFLTRKQPQKHRHQTHCHIFCKYDPSVQNDSQAYKKEYSLLQDKWGRWDKQGQGEGKRNHPHLGVRKVKQLCALRNISKSTIPKPISNSR